MADGEKTRCSHDFRDPARRQKQKGDGTIRFKTGFRNTVFQAMRSRGWRHTESDMDWDIHWAERDWMFEVFDNVHLEAWQRVNHYRNDKELCRKDLLVKNLKRHRKQLIKDGRAEEAEAFSFWPTTYVLPGDYALFAEEFKRHQGATWIMKPIGRSQGKGIFLFNKLSQINMWKSEHRWRPGNPDAETYVVQRYITNPYLLAGRKFDIRIYALVTSFSPLTVYLYRNGFARFSNTRYSNAASDLTNNLVHLTNVAIQKTADNYDRSSGGKWNLRSLKLFLISCYGTAVVDQLFREIQSIVLRSLQSVQRVIINDKHCFELYGYDVIFDDTLKPWLLEVNASPSLTANTPEDAAMKTAMLNSVFDIVDMERRLQGDEMQVGGFDLICYQGREVADPPSVYSCNLGCDLPPRPRPSQRRNSQARAAAAGAGAGAASPQPAGGAAAAAKRRGVGRSSPSSGASSPASSRGGGAAAGAGAAASGAAGAGAASTPERRKPARSASGGVVARTRDAVARGRRAKPAPPLRREPRPARAE